MKDFKDFNIKFEYKSFIGDKIKMDRILNREIIVHDYKIEDSKYYKENESKCLNIQIELGSIKHILFTGSKSLLEMIQKVKKEDFPFKTIITKENQYLEFS